MALNSDFTSQYTVATEACGFIDNSARGKLALTGSEAKLFLNGQVTNEIETLEAGSGCYNAFLTAKGKMLGDLEVLDTGAELLLVTERSTLQPLFDRITSTLIGFDAQLHKRTLQRGLVSLIGPHSAQAVGAEELPPTEYSNIQLDVGGVAVTAVRSLFGVDLICASESTSQLLQQLEGLGLPLLDESISECLRIEAGRPRYGFELDHNTIPQEAALNERAVSFTKGCYVGQETVARLYYKGKPNRHLRGLSFTTLPTAADDLELFKAERSVGKVGSYTESPRFGPIGLALIRREATPGEMVTNTGFSVNATVVELPFNTIYETK